MAIERQGDRGDVSLWALHGAFGMASDWDEAMRWLGRGIEVRAPDLWASVGGAEEMGEWAARMVEGVKAEGEGRRFLLGYSMGGRLALALLAAGQELWEGAIVVSAHPGLAEGDREGRAARAARDVGWLRALGELEVEQFWERWAGQGVFGEVREDAAWREGRLAMLGARRAELGAAFGAWSLARQPDYRAMLRRPGVPILWVTGGLDEKFSGLAAEVAKGSGRVRRVVLEGAGHRVPWERTEEFWGECRRFLASCGVALGGGAGGGGEDLH
jgi:2-succinyl-6-hydroxy-2,4-cyclohexadiene-1-carboxylate synthase